MLFVPSVDGSASIRAEPRAFMAAFASRVETGLLPRAARSRSQYVIVEKAADRVRFRAATWWTAINVGLNDVELTAGADGRVHYAIRYWRWAAYVIGFCALLGVILAGVFLSLDIRDYIARNPASQSPGLSLDQNVVLAWGMVLFWGAAWPWILIPLHKKPLRRLMEKIIEEVDAAVP